jgi:hypothetical protein
MQTRLREVIEWLPSDFGKLVEEILGSMKPKRASFSPVDCFRFEI